MRYISRTIVVFSSIALLLPCCSSAEEQETKEEIFYKDLLFSNNITGKTYYSSLMSPSLWFNGECISQRQPDPYKKMEQYKRLKVSIVDFTKDPVVADSYLHGLLANFADAMDGYTQTWIPDEGRRKKDSDASFSCIDIKLPDDLKQRYLVSPKTRYMFETDKIRFDQLWKKKRNENGFSSPSRIATPNCFVEVKADAENNVRSTDIHVLMKDYSRSSFQSPLTWGCLVRGSYAAFGVPGVLNKPDEDLLFPDYKKGFDSSSWHSTIYWKPEPMGAPRLYDGPGWRWPQVKAEIRRLKALQRNEK